jgi:GxxExxY protein
MVIPVHRAQVLTYLKIGGWQIALLLNFNVPILKQGIERFVLGLPENGRNQLSVNSAPNNLPQPCPYSLHAAIDSGDSEAERLAQEIIAGAGEVHRELGPGLLPSAYDACLCHELYVRGLPFERKHRLPLQYKGVLLSESYEVDLIVGGRVVVAPWSLACIQPVHEARLLSQLRLGGWRLGLLFNFNATSLGEGIGRILLSSNKSWRR